jgi:hypothetical protein
MSEDKTCFVVSQIGPQGSETRDRADTLRDRVIEPTVSKYGYEVQRSDSMAEPGMITPNIIEMVINSELVIADLTGHNANVFYELAVRHAANEPVIQLIDRGEDIPFDVADTRTIYYDFGDFEITEEAKSQIAEQVEAIEDSSGDYDTPISVGVDLMELREGGTSEEQEIADIKEAIANLNSSVTAIRNSIDEGHGKLFTQEQVETEIKHQITNILKSLIYLSGEIESIDPIDEDSEFKIKQRMGDIQSSAVEVGRRLGMEEEVLESMKDDIDSMTN